MTSHTASVTSYGTPLRLLLAWLGVGGRGAGVGGRAGRLLLPSQGENPESSGRDWDARTRPEEGGREGIKIQGNSLGRRDMEARGTSDDVDDGAADIIFI